MKRSHSSSEIHPEENPEKSQQISPPCAIACRRPNFGPGQVAIVDPGAAHLDPMNTLVVIRNVLQEADLQAYTEKAVLVERFGGESRYGTKPRKEVCYTTDGRPYHYSGKDQETVKYPDHVLRIFPLLLKVLDESGYLPAKNTFTELSNGVDIIYSSEIPLGGSISAHSDNEDDWGLVLILSMGQDRWLRVRRNSDKKWWNVLMKHNSLVAMHGATFQRLYRHQVDKLKKGEPIGTRLSLNLRFKECK